jgi:hypothetical protein
MFSELEPIDPAVVIADTLDVFSALIPANIEFISPRVGSRLAGRLCCECTALVRGFLINLAP